MLSFFLATVKKAMTKMFKGQQITCYVLVPHGHQIAPLQSACAATERVLEH